MDKAAIIDEIRQYAEEKRKKDISLYLMPDEVLYKDLEAELHLCRDTINKIMQALIDQGMYTRRDVQVGQKRFAAFRKV